MNKFEIATKEKMLFYKATLFLLAKLNIIDDKSISALVRTHAFKQLKRQYLNFVENFEPSKKQRLNCNKVWICWFQGIENAPDIVKKCVDSIKKNINDREIVIITKENYSKYVTLPDYIIDKWEKGIISNAHFSDILRIELLIEHGGLWLDATTYCTGAVPDYIDNSDLFVYNTDYWHNSTLIMGNWLMGAKSHSPILELTQDLLYSYWKKRKLCQKLFFDAFIFCNGCGQIS